MSPTSQAQSPSNHQSNNGGPTGQHFQPSIHPENDGQQDWHQNTWSGGSGQSEIFNQSDRINLNTRLKTMILHKNEKDQQQSSGNHFLSHSHQHLPEQQHQLENISNLNSNTKPISNETKLIEAGNVGGTETDDFRKSSVMKQDKDEIKRSDYFDHKQSAEKDSREDIEKRKFGEAALKDQNQNKSQSAESENLPSDQQKIEGVGNLTKQEKTFESERERQSYSYHSAQEYQQHKNMVNNIKKENVDDAAGNVKFEGYEKNYQNFIRYADYCDAQQPQYENPQKQAPFQQEYAQSQAYFNNYPYQGAYGGSSQNYGQTHTQGYQQFISQQHGLAHQSSSLTNFEQQIPLHAYPIPKNIGETILPQANIKTEPALSSSVQPFSMLNENLTCVEKDELGHYRQDNETRIEESANLVPKEEV